MCLVSESSLHIIFNGFHTFFQGKNGREESLRNFKGHLEKSYIPRNRRWMVLFPEGGFLRKRREVSQRYAQKNNLPKLNNVTLPRVGALKAILEVLPIREAPGNNNSPKVIGNGTSKIQQSTSTLVEEGWLFRFHIDNSNLTNLNSFQSKIFRTTKITWTMYWTLQ